MTTIHAVNLVTVVMATLLTVVMTTMPRSPSSLIPSMPPRYMELLLANSAGNFASLWLSTVQGDANSTENYVANEAWTFLAPKEEWMMRLSPADAPSVALDEHPDSTAFRKYFIRDHFSYAALNISDPRLTKEGVTIQNLNTKSLHFKKSSSGQFIVNGIVAQIVPHALDHNIILVLEGLLFNHTGEIDEKIMEISVREGASLSHGRWL